MGIHIRRSFRSSADKPGTVVISTHFHIDDVVEGEAEFDMVEFVKELKPKDRSELLNALRESSESPACEGGIHPVDAYYAMSRGDLDTVRKFVCECAGRIA